MAVYDEIAHVSVRMERNFKEECVYNVIAEGGIKVGKDDHKFVNTRFVSPQDLNSKSTLFGGTVLAWFDSDAAAFAYECVKEDCIFTTISVFGFNFKKPVMSGARIRGTMRLAHNSVSTITIKGVYEVFENGWIICAEGYCALCCIEKEGKPTLLPELVVQPEKNTPEWEFVEKYKKITILKRKGKIHET